MLGEQTPLVTRSLWIGWCFCYCVYKPAVAFIADKNQEINFRAAPQDMVWPLPQNHWTIENQLLAINPASFRLEAWPPESVVLCDIVSNALSRYKDLVTPKMGAMVDPGLTVLGYLNVTVKRYKEEDCGYPRFKDDESYTLHVYNDPAEATLTATTVWGMLRGLETFSQLVYQHPASQSYVINVTKIQDWPRFPHRGILVDTARHFIPLRLLKKNLDAMSFNKMNVFHWHIVDDQSFPFESKIYPNLTKMGAFSPHHVYKQEDIHDIIEYARLRGIRVVPEFDTPGHTRSIARAFPELVTKCYYNQRMTDFTGSGNQVTKDGLDPTRESTYRLVRNLLQEFKSIFKDHYIHLGMDETNLQCWMSNPRIQKFMMLRGIPNEQYLEEYYARRIINITQSMGYKYVIWEDPLENGVQVSPETVVQVWKPGWMSRARQVAAKKHQMVLSACWYINMIQYGEPWTTYYDCNPLAFSTNKSERELMLGGEACLWAEYIDSTNLISTLWPSAAAVAERLWNGDETLIADYECRIRYDQHRCRMLRRGIQAQPIYSGYCPDDQLDDDDDYDSTSAVSTFRHKPDMLFLWIPVFVSILGCLYWLTLSRSVLRAACAKCCHLRKYTRWKRMSGSEIRRT